MLALLQRLEDTGPYKRCRERLNRRLAVFLASVISRRPPPGGGRILEAACGSAYSAHLLAAEPVVRLSVGLDRDLRLFRGGGVRNPRTRLVIGDLQKSPFAPGVFDLVWNSSSVEEFADPARAVTEMVSLVKPGGLIFVGVPYLYSPLGLYYLVPLRPVREWLGRPFSGRKLKHLLEDCGLTVETRITYLGGFFIGMLARKV
jgi:SAM-dependent methyltransferase